MYRWNSLPAHGYPIPGTIVFVTFLIFWRHRGIVSDRWYAGKPMVISASGRAGAVREEPWDTFADGSQVWSEGFPSTLAPQEVVRRARAFIGTQYQVTQWNCDHLVGAAHGLKPESPQLAGTIAVALVAATMIAATQRR